jgi:cytochrome c553
MTASSTPLVAGADAVAASLRDAAACAVRAHSARRRRTVARLGPLLATAAIAMAVAGAAEAGNVAAGRAKALACQACHGLDGLSKTPEAPNIAGQSEPYLVLQLQAFKSGARRNEAMTLVAATLSDAEIADLAAYYAAIEIRVVKMPG